MGKKKKDNKHEVPSDGEDQTKKVLASKYFTNVKWLDQMHNIDRLVDFNGNTLLSSTLCTVVSEFANRFLLDYEKGWNVTYARQKYFQYCGYELTPLFAIFWLDYYIDTVATALYSCAYHNTFDNSEFKDNTTKRDKEADKAGTEVQNTFLKYIENHNKEFK